MKGAPAMRRGGPGRSTLDVRRVLIVDPDRRFRTEVKRLLGREGRVVEVCEDFSEALRTVSRERFGCAIVAASLPEIMGHDAAAILRMIDPGMEIILAIKEYSREIERRARQGNFMYLYIKSVDRHELELAVASALEKRAGLFPPRRQAGQLEARP